MRYHLWFKKFSQTSPHGVQTHSCAVSGAPDCPYSFVSGSCSGMYSYDPLIFLHQPNTLCKAFLALLVSIIALSYFCSLYTRLFQNASLFSIYFFHTYTGRSLCSACKTHVFVHPHHDKLQSKDNSRYTFLTADFP